MIVCTQCSGNGATIGQNQILAQNGTYTETFQRPWGTPGAIPCSQCNGKGYQTGGSF